MQEALDHWEAGLTATGGAIVPSKSFWYLVDYKWTHGTWTYHNPSFPTTLHVRDHNRQLHSLRRLPLDSAQRTLGVYLSPTGQDITQRNVLREKSTQWALRLRSAHLPKSCCLPAYRTTILKSLQYPLLATCLSRKDLHYVQTPACTAALQCSGIGADIPLSVCFGPLSRQGLGIPHLYDTQYVDHISAIMSSFNSHPSILQQLLQTSAEVMKLELRLSGFLFQHDYSRCHFLVTDCWLKSTW